LKVLFISVTNAHLNTISIVSG